MHTMLSKIREHETLQRNLLIEVVESRARSAVEFDQPQQE
jgi:hypothetical protein